MTPDATHVTASVTTGMTARTLAVLRITGESLLEGETLRLYPESEDLPALNVKNGEVVTTHVVLTAIQIE